MGYVTHLWYNWGWWISGSYCFNHITCSGNDT